MENIITAEEAKVLLKIKNKELKDLSIVFNKIRRTIEDGENEMSFKSSSLQLESEEINYLRSLGYQVLYNSQTTKYIVSWY